MAALSTLWAGVFVRRFRPTYHCRGELRAGTKKAPSPQGRKKTRVAVAEIAQHRSSRGHRFC